MYMEYMQYMEQYRRAAIITAATAVTAEVIRRRRLAAVVVMLYLLKKRKRFKRIPHKKKQKAYAISYKGLTEGTSSLIREPQTKKKFHM